MKIQWFLQGYFRFTDRASTNYRWKGENISSVEVEGVLSRLAGWRVVAAYGVKIPGSDGSAGMCTIADPDGSLRNTQLQQLASDVKKNLPSYAIPLFLRIAQNIETTGGGNEMKSIHQKNESSWNIFQIPDYAKWFRFSKGFGIKWGLFLNFVHGLAGTYKMMKTSLAAEGYDLNKVTDSIFFYNKSRHGDEEYKPLTTDLYERIKAGELSL
jgi:hypothetical protein